jgi:hypothetical protein
MRNILGIKIFIPFTFTAVELKTVLHPAPNILLYVNILHFQGEVLYNTL